MDDSSTALREKHCAPGEDGMPPLLPEQIELLLKNVHGWRLVSDGKRIRKEWRMQNFAAALEFFNDVGKIAEDEDHHPDLHLVDFRNVAIELSTHAADGLTENDFILASKIDELAVRLKE
jgi:4a-hydroxytetrahydrobiopterin dehydratase